MHRKMRLPLSLGLTLVIVSGLLLSSPVQLVSAGADAATALPGKAASASPAAAVAPPGMRVHIGKKGDNFTSLARLYLAESQYLTQAELEAAMRASNPGQQGKTVKPGESILIPGMEPRPADKPNRVPRDFEVRAIYLTGVMAASPRGMQLIRNWRQSGGNAVVFDVKDSDGIVNIPFAHPLATTRRPYIRNLAKYVHFLHGQGMHAIARISIFRDESLVQRHPELAVRSRRWGRAWSENGKLVWVDPSRSDVQQYNIELAAAAVEAGVDEIQFDYVRFPAEGDQKDAQFAFEAAHRNWQRADVIADFLQTAYDRLHPMGVLVSLDVFGVMAWQRPIDLAHTGQDIVAMAHYCDVLSPMIYPSHFFGMDGYALPGDAPEHFISTSMERFRQITAGSGVVLRPWLQAFGWKTKTYSPEYIARQVIVSKQKGGIGFLFWNARNDYSKPFAAMPEMRSAPGKFFRGDELPKSKIAAKRSQAQTI
jgi:hypothetical protein